MKEYKLERMGGSNVLITGGLGFVGSNLAHKLVLLGANITLYDCLLPDHGGNFANIKEIKDKVKVVIGDVRDFNLLKENIANQNYIFHCAAQVSHTDSIRDPFLDIDINCKGTINLLEACRQSDDKAKIIYAGTRGEVGRLQKLNADESHYENPVDVQGINKLVAEKYCLMYQKVYGIKTTSLRINNTYGPRHQIKHTKFGVLNYFIRLVIEGKKIPIYEPGTQIKDYNYIDDVVDALILVAQNDKANGEVFFVGSGVGYKFIDLAKLIIKIAGSGEIEIVPWTKERLEIEIGDFLVSFDKIKNMLGWYPRTDIETGLKKTVEFYRERLNEYIQ